MQKNGFNQKLDVPPFGDAESSALDGAEAGGDNIDVDGVVDPVSIEGEDDGAQAVDPVSLIVAPIDELKNVLAAELSTDTTQYYLNQIGTRPLFVPRVAVRRRRHHVRHAGAALDEMQRRVHMRAGVHFCFYFKMAKAIPGNS